MSIHKIYHDFGERKISKQVLFDTSLEINRGKIALMIQTYSDSLGLFRSQLNSQTNKNYSCYFPSHIDQGIFRANNSRSLGC